MKKNVQIAAYTLTEKEKEMLALVDTIVDSGKRAGQPVSFSEIAKRVFGGRVTRQGVQARVRAAKRKLFRFNANQRYKNPGDVPIKECPIPARTRKSLIDGGYKKLGQLLGLTEKEIGAIKGVGPGGAVYAAELIYRWNVGKSQNSITCPNCGKVTGEKPRSIKTFARTCKHCGASFEVTQAA